MYLSIIGVIIALVLTVYLLYKGWAPHYVIILPIAILVLTNGMGFVETLTGVFLPAIFDSGQTLFFMMVFGAVLGGIYTQSGAALSISTALYNLVVRETDSKETQQMKVVWIIIAVSAVLVLGGVSILVSIFTLLAIILDLAKRADIPRKYLIGILSGGTSAWTQTMPFAPTAPNILAIDFLGTETNASWVAGILAIFLELIVMHFLFKALLKKSRAKEERFIPFNDDPKWDPGKKLPNPFVALIPLVTLFITYNLGIELLYTLLIAIAIAAALYWRDIKDYGFKKLFNETSSEAVSGLFTIVIMIGFGSVVTSSAGFTAIAEGIMGVALPPLFLVIIVMLILAAFTGNNSGAEGIFLNGFGAQFLARFPSVTPAALHRVSVFACTTTDSLPTSGAFLFFCNKLHTTPRESYYACLISTVIATLVGAVFVATLMTIFPSLP